MVQATPILGRACTTRRRGLGAAFLVTRHPQPPLLHHPTASTTHRRRQRRQECRMVVTMGSGADLKDRDLFPRYPPPSGSDGMGMGDCHALPNQQPRHAGRVLVQIDLKGRPKLFVGERFVPEGGDETIQRHFTHRLPHHHAHNHHQERGFMLVLLASLKPKRLMLRSRRPRRGLGLELLPLVVHGGVGLIGRGLLDRGGGRERRGRLLDGRGDNGCRDLGSFRIPENPHPLGKLFAEVGDFDLTSVGQDQYTLLHQLIHNGGGERVFPVPPFPVLTLLKPLGTRSHAVQKCNMHSVQLQVEPRRQKLPLVQLATV